MSVFDFMQDMIGRVVTEDRVILSTATKMSGKPKPGGGFEFEPAAFTVIAPGAAVGVQLLIYHNVSGSWVEWFVLKDGPRTWQVTSGDLFRFNGKLTLV